MWTKQQLLQLTTSEAITERFRLHSLRSNYQLQNVDPPQEPLADIDLLKDDIEAHFELKQIILNSITVVFMAEINSLMTSDNN